MRSNSFNGFGHQRAASHNNSYGRNINQGDELINFASEVLSRSMKVGGNNSKASSNNHNSKKFKEKSLKRFNYSLQVTSGNGNKNNGNNSRQ